MIELSIDGHVAECRLNAPPVNTINPEWCHAFHEVLDVIEKNRSVRVVHLRSSLKLFCVGADLKHVAARYTSSDGAAGFSSDLKLFQELFSRIEGIAPVTVAEINGAALGGGLELALACDLRVASEDARLGLPELGLGLLPAIGGTQRLTKVCGPSTAKRLIFTGEILTGAEAASLGVAHWAFAAEKLREEAEAIVGRVSGMSGEALLSAKDCIAAAAYSTQQGYDLELSRSDLLFHSSDTRERVRKFLERKSSRS